MRRLAKMLIEVTLLLSVLAALLYIVRIIAASFIPLEWYWGGALAVSVAPLALASALWLLERVDRPERAL